MSLDLAASVVPSVAYTRNHAEQQSLWPAVAMAGVATLKEATESEISCKMPETRTDIASHTQKQISINFDESQV